MILKMKKAFSLLFVVMLLFGMMPTAVADSVSSESDPLAPSPIHYDSNGNVVSDNGKIVLSKQAKRVGPAEWEVTVTAEIKENEIQKQQIELVVLLDLSGSMNWCTDPAHGVGNHVHSASCVQNPDCGQESHVHMDACYGSECTNWRHSLSGHGSSCIAKSDGVYYQKKCNAHVHSTSCCHHQTQNGYQSQCFYYDANGKTVKRPSRLEFAYDSIQTLTNGLPENTEVTYATFKANTRKVAECNIFKSYEAFCQDTTDAYTPLREGTLNALTAFDEESSSKKFFVIVTDGDSTDNYPTNDPEFVAFKNNGGTVFTVGFTHQNEQLVQMAAPNGKFMFAEDEEELGIAIEDIKETISAMINDPMGDQVDYISGSLSFDNSLFDEEEFNTENDHIFWNPTTDPVSTGTYSYTYRVKLTNEAISKAGSVKNIPLNKTTTLNFSAGDTSYVANFPIPMAEYEASSIQVNWKCGELDVKPPTKTEGVICKYETGEGEEKYIPSFKTDDQIAQEDKKIHASGLNYYNYTDTTIIRIDEKGREEKVDSIDPSLPYAYIVTHNYMLDEMYEVVYEYTPDSFIPEDAPEASGFNEAFKPDETVTVPSPAAEGYLFTGWTIVEPANVSLTSDSFVMPKQNVKLQGSWVKLPSYKVLVNYFTKTDGGAYEAESENPVEFVPVTYTDEASVDLSYADALVYNGNTYGEIELESGNAVIDEENQKLTGIVPAADTAVIEINLYREVKNSYKLYVKEVFTDGTAHEDYSAAYYRWDEVDYSFDSSWEVTPKPAPEGYVLENQQSGEAAGSEEDAAVTPGLSGESFGTKDKYVVVTYRKLPSYKVLVNYFTKTDGGAYEAESENPVEFVPVTYTDEASVDLSYADALVYNGNTYGEIELESGNAVIDEENQKLTGIVPAADTAVIEINLYREVKNSYKLYVKEVFTDGTTHEGYSAAYYRWDEVDYSFDSSWEVTPKPAPEGYVLESQQSGEAAGSEEDAAVTPGLSGESFGTKDKYVVVTYRKLPSYKVLVNYFTKTDGGAYEAESENPVEFVPVTYTDEASVDLSYADALVYNGNTYGEIELESGNAVIDEENQKLTGIVPAADTAVVEINLYREVKNSYKLYVKEVFTDGTAHEDYSAAYYRWDEVDYSFDSSWEVTPKPAPEGYVLESQQSGEAAGSEEDAAVTPGLSGESFGAKDKYVVVTYRKLPSYKVLVNYFTKTDGGAYEAESENPVEFVPVTYTDEASVELSYADALVYNGNTYGEIELESGNAVIDEENQKLTGIVPAADTAVVEINLYREVKNSYKLYVKEVFTDGTAHEGYSAAYYRWDEVDYSFDSSWEVTPKPAPEGYVLENQQSGEAAGSEEDAAVTPGLSGESFGAKDKYVVVTYAKRLTAKATVRYVDENGNELKTAYVSQPVYVDDHYDVSASKKETITSGSQIFDFAYDDTEVNQTAYSGKMPSAGIVITRIYIEREKASAVVHFVDADGNPLREDMIETRYIGSAYDLSSAETVESIVVDGIKYDFYRDNITSANIAYTGTMSSDGAEITRIYLERGKTQVVVHYVDQEGIALREDTSQTGYIGDPYDVSSALSVTNIVVDGKEYEFVSHHRSEQEKNTTESVMPLTDSMYSGILSEEGLEIVRVYKLQNIVYYYSLKHVYTGYDANGNIVYSGTEEWPATGTAAQNYTIQSPALYEHAGKQFRRVSDATQTADLSGTTAETPYVFTVYYEWRETGTSNPPIDELPPQTGDSGYGLWIALMAASLIAFLVLKATERRYQ